MRPTIVLVHGEFAGSALWNDVVAPLLEAGLHVIAAANRLRGLAADAAAVSDLVGSTDGPIVLAGHSYGGAVVTNVDSAAGEILGLVYAAGFAPERGETCFALAGEVPGTIRGDVLDTAVRSDGAADLTISADRFYEQFAADLPSSRAARMAVTQRPIAREALLEPSGGRPLWKELPSWFAFGEEDRMVPAAAHRRMADRAGAQRVLSLPGVSHAVTVSQPLVTTDLILQAASLSMPARLG
jgi:pimeloyl-ACP methyl ester carboxylesterase